MGPPGPRRPGRSRARGAWCVLPPPPHLHGLQQLVAAGELASFLARRDRRAEAHSGGAQLAARACYRAARARVATRLPSRQRRSPR